MYKYLVKHLKAIRSDAKQTFKIKCEAQNTLTALITCIQTQEKLYNHFLFKDDMWCHIVNPNEKWSFPLEFSNEDLPAKR